jgi:hypothetical protein
MIIRAQDNCPLFCGCSQIPAGEATFASEVSAKMRALGMRETRFL